MYTQCFEGDLFLNSLTQDIHSKVEIPLETKPSGNSSLHSLLSCQLLPVHWGKALSRCPYHRTNHTSFKATGLPQLLRQSNNWSNIQGGIKNNTLFQLVSCLTGCTSASPGQSSTSYSNRSTTGETWKSRGAAFIPLLTARLHRLLQTPELQICLVPVWRTGCFNLHGTKKAYCVVLKSPVSTTRLSSPRKSLSLRWNDVEIPVMGVMQ